MILLFHTFFIGWRVCGGLFVMLFFRITLSTFFDNYFQFLLDFLLADFGLILLCLDIEIPPSRFYISVSYLRVAYQQSEQASFGFRYGFIPPDQTVGVPQSGQNFPLTIFRQLGQKRSPEGAAACWGWAGAAGWAGC